MAQPLRETPLPAELARLPLGVLRPKDAAGVYAHPRPELARLAKAGLLHRAARGYYVVVPREYVGRPWLPELEAVAAGIASAVYGPDDAVLMGISAARIHGAIPRAMATAVVAVPRQHRPIELTDRTATIRFVRRDTKVLDAERITTSLGPALVTTREQTVLDLAKRPHLGDATIDAEQAIPVLYRRSDPTRLTGLAEAQGLATTLRRVIENVGGDR